MNVCGMYTSEELEEILSKTEPLTNQELSEIKSTLERFPEGSIRPLLCKIVKRIELQPQEIGSLKNKLQSRRVKLNRKE